ncbi:MAG: DUF6361 family protein [Terriglobia bacterium]
MSSLSWIDFDEVERQRARRIMALFQEKDSRDELGLGPIRDSIADHLFPGTSTIQTRLRYMLFVPWIYAMVEQRDGPPEQLGAEARTREVRLIDALRAGGEDEGIIGRDAGANLQRLASSVYWAGLRSWGIRLFPGSQEAYFAALPSLRRRRRRAGSSEDALAAEDHDLLTWRAGMPPAPDDLLENADFRLTSEEAGFLIDRLVDSQPNSLLTHLAKAGRHADCEFIWEHPDLATFPSAARRLVEHAEVFSQVMHGASLLYNLMLSELRRKEEWKEKYRDALDKWANELDPAVVAAWSLDDFWQWIAHENHRVREPARRFVRRWLELIGQDAVKAPDLPAARELVRTREIRLKGAQSRFVNRSVLDRWGGRSGTRRLAFRWTEASSHIRDLADAH